MKRWLTDWRGLLVMVIAAVLVALLVVLVVRSIQDRGRALDAAIAATASERESRQAAVQRIDELLGEIGALQQTAQANGRQLAMLRQEITLLQRQVRDMGGQPVVSGDASSSGAQPTATATVSATPRPTRSPRPTPRPTPKPSPSRTCLPMTRICT